MKGKVSNQLIEKQEKRFKKCKSEMRQLFSLIKRPDEVIYEE